MTDPDTRQSGGFGRAGGGETGPGFGLSDAPVARWVQWAGTAVSAVLILGVVVWGYKLAVRDVSGVPIIRALDGPGRIAPSDPGGDMAAHVGLAVNEVAGSGLAAPGPDRVVLAPPPTGLSKDDAPMADLRPLPELAPAPKTAPEAGPTPVAPVPDSALPPKPAPEPGAALPPDAPAETEVAPEGEAAASAEAPIPADVPGLARSPRPPARPAGDLIAEAAALAVAEALAPVAADGAEEVEAGSLPAGTRLAQINVYDSPEEARAYWGRVAERFEPLMAGKKRIVQEATSGGRKFWRLRVAGFKDVDEARQFCAALVAEGESCVPTMLK